MDLCGTHCFDCLNLLANALLYSIQSNNNWTLPSCNPSCPCLIAVKSVNLSSDKNLVY